MNSSTGGKLFFVIFMVAVTLWRGWETFRKQGSARGQTSMLWSFYALFAFSCVIFLGTIAEFFLVDRLWNPVWAVAGTLLFAGANWLRVTAIRTLGKFWSLHIEIRDEHQFVRNGVYQYLRHPAYASFVLEAIAVPLVGNAWWSLLVVLGGYVPLLWYRLHCEDAALVAKFGDSYRTYQHEVGALFPRRKRTLDF
jgi:protein-S-isoprenylcysteine O-methyltransferase Ste14